MTEAEKKFAQGIGRAIAAQRKKQGINQSELAELIGVEQETISRFERGVTLPPLGRLNDMANALSCPIENLIREGSPRLEDTVQLLAVAMKGLAEEDKKLIVTVVGQLCGRLRNERRK